MLTADVLRLYNEKYINTRIVKFIILIQSMSTCPCSLTTQVSYGFILIAPKIAGKERKIMGWKKGIHLLCKYRYSS
jgi:hypothetical protein